MPSAEPSPALQTLRFEQPIKYDDSSSAATTDARLLTAQEVANRLGVSERWVRDHATRRSPRIPAVKLGSLLRFRSSDVEDFVIANRLPIPSKSRMAGV
jgi:excisionase family DNA binding protein